MDLIDEIKKNPKDGSFESNDEEINVIFHKIWGRAKGSIYYDKSEWTQLVRLLNERGIKV